MKQGMDKFEYICMREADVPAVRILNLTSGAKYKMPADEVTGEPKTILPELSKWKSKGMSINNEMPLYYTS